MRVKERKTARERERRAGGEAGRRGRKRECTAMLMRQTEPGEFNWNLAIIKRL